MENNHIQDVCDANSFELKLRIEVHKKRSSSQNSINADKTKIQCKSAIDVVPRLVKW